MRVSSRDRDTTLDAVPAGVLLLPSLPLVVATKATDRNSRKMRSATDTTGYQEEGQDRDKERENVHRRNTLPCSLTRQQLMPQLLQSRRQPPSSHSSFTQSPTSPPSTSTSSTSTQTSTQAYACSRCSVRPLRIREYTETGRGGRRRTCDARGDGRATRCESSRGGTVK